LDVIFGSIFFIKKIKDWHWRWRRGTM